VGVGHSVGTGAVLRGPLVRTGRALHELPLVAEERLEVAVVPAHRGGRPRALKPAGDRVGTLAAAMAVAPPEALLRQGGAFGLGTDVLVRVGRAVGLAEGVSAGDQGDRLLVVHRHATERLADVAGRGGGVRVAVRTLRVD